MLVEVGNIAQKGEIDFLTWHGDNSAHDVWMNTAEEVTYYTKNISDVLG